MCTMAMQLKDLRGIGKKMLEDFEQLGIRSVDDLKSRDARRIRHLPLHDRAGAEPGFAERAERLVVLVAAARTIKPGQWLPDSSPRQD
jgi:hypothetical protein